LLSATWRVLAFVGRIERVLGMALLVAIVLMISVQVATRYLLGRPIVWTEDVATFAFIWLVFLGAAAGLKDMRHIRIETFLGHLPGSAGALLQAVLHAIILVCCTVVAWHALGVMETESRSSTISLPINLPRHLFYSVPLCVSLTSMALTSAWFIAAHLAEAATGRVPDAVREAEARRERDHAAEEAEARIAERAL
jgi:TRAP-type C4-dicarboxylate transport system permease small subunit